MLDIDNLQTGMLENVSTTLGQALRRHDYKGVSPIPPLSVRLQRKDACRVRQLSSSQAL